MKKGSRRVRRMRGGDAYHHVSNVVGNMGSQHANPLQGNAIQQAPMAGGAAGTSVLVPAGLLLANQFMRRSRRNRSRRNRKTYGRRR